MELKYCPRDRDFSDAGNALTFSELHKADIAFNKAFDWTVWNGTIWEQSEEKATLAADKFTAAMRDEAKENFISAQGAVVRLEVADEKDGEAIKKAKSIADAAKAYFVFAKSSRNGPRIREILKLSKGRLAVPAEQFDKDAHLLNCPDYVIDLRSGATYPHDPTFYQTNVTRFSPCDEGMEEWMEHVKAVCGGDSELAHGVQLLCGSALFGEVYQEGLDFLFGDGGTGKSTLFNSVFQVLGSYSRSFDVNAFVSDNDDAAKRLAAHLRG